MSLFTAFRKILINSPKAFGWQSNWNSILKCSSSATFNYDKDPGPLFTDDEIQKLLKSLTRMRLETIFKKRSVPDNTVQYKFMTTEELEKEYEKVAKLAEDKLQMPPVVQIKEDVLKIISKDPALKDFSECNYVITDITYGVKPSNRKVLIRQVDGTLQYAPLSLQKRMNQIYFPLKGRQLRLPHVFEPEHLQKRLDEYKYEFILDRLCIQFEPYERDFHEIASKVYTHINEMKKFDDLRSTRHFGPMVFFLAWHKLIDDLLCDMIKRDFLQNGVELIVLMYRLNSIDYDRSIEQKIKYKHPSEEAVRELKKSVSGSSDDIHEEIKTAIGKSKEDFEADDICLEFIEDYVAKKALKKMPLELAIQTFRETNDEKRKLYQGLTKAHGVN